jgi:hypothetical protein
MLRQYGQAGGSSSAGWLTNCRVTFMQLVKCLSCLKLCSICSMLATECRQLVIGMLLLVHQWHTDQAVAGMVSFC